MKLIFSIFLALLLILLIVDLLESSKIPKLKMAKIINEIVNMDINNIDLPLINNGRTGNATRAYYPNGTNLSFLYDGGFATSGYVNGDIRISWTVTDALALEWQPGKWAMAPEDTLARFYVVNQSDDFGSLAYIDWADAVTLGANFQDLNQDGIYDPFVDRPDILGDRTIWTVFNDGTPDTVRNYGFRTLPMGLEIHQTVWAFAQTGPLGDIIFFRYRLINADINNVDSLIFSLYADSDIGDPLDDLTGCNPELQLGYNYNDGADSDYGVNPPAFGMQLLQGPIVNAPGDTAYHYRGPYFGTDTIQDKTNLFMTSYMPYEKNPMPPLSIPEDSLQARFAQVGGLDKFGNPIDPTTWGTGGSASDDPKFAFSGDPVTGNGWLDNNSRDRRQLVNCGPFQMAAGDTQDVICAYVLGRGKDALEGITVMRQNAQVALEYIRNPMIVNIRDNEWHFINHFRLYQNYPNPFNSETTISFHLKKSGEITLELFNVLGKKISTLMKRDLASGEYMYRFRMAELPSGIYYYRINSVEGSITKKMLLLK
jgi:hypothetical protein